MLPDNKCKTDNPIEAEASPGLQQQDKEDISDPPNLVVHEPTDCSSSDDSDDESDTPWVDHLSTMQPSLTHALTSLPKNGE
jgi:hypothetical protein